jgi:tetratricopeptide (TPR) repeat protein
MKRAIYYTASRRHTFIAFFGITVLLFVLLMNIAGATQDSDAWFNKGNALANLNKYDEAITVFDKAIEINPQDSITWYSKGVALSYLNRLDEAIKAYDKSIEINPQIKIIACVYELQIGVFRKDSN